MKAGAIGRDGAEATAGIAVRVNDDTASAFQLIPTVRFARARTAAAACAIALCLPLPATVGFAQTPQVQTSAAAPPDVAPAIQEQVERAAPREPPVSMLRRIRWEYDLPRPFNERVIDELAFERLASGLWGVTETSRHTSLTHSSRRLALQGVLDLAKLQEMSGKGLQLLWIWSIAGIAGTLEPLVSPVAGTQFSLEVTREFRSSLIAERKSLFGGAEPRTGGIARVDKYKMSCKVENEADATALHPALKGNYLRVVCTSGASPATSYAYLMDSGFYLTLVKEWDKHRLPLRITEVEYAP